MGNHNVQNKLQADEKSRNWKIFEKNNIINFKTFRNKLAALSNIIHSILYSRPMRPVSILRPHEE